MKTFKQFVDELNAGPSTPVENYGNMGYMPNLGAGRIGNVKLKKPIPMPPKV